ncbi:MAG: TolC family protein [Methylococcales bacterium]|nr:TolC family protein [Methylococcales bacterium]
MNFSRKVTLSFAIMVSLTGCINPKSLSVDEIAESALADVTQIYAEQEPIDGPLTLSDAMARALKYNLNNRVKLMEQAVAHQSVEMAKLDMLPMLGVSAGYLNRNNVDASESVSIFTGRQSLEPSTSQDRERYIADLRFTWNLLDFGVSYFQAKQNADRFLISQKAREKVMLKLLQQVRSAYWRAVIMQRMERDVNAILKSVKESLRDLKEVREQQLYTPLFALNDIRLLVETQDQLVGLKESISIANVELTTLINVPPTTKLKLATSQKFKAIPVIPNKIEEMELTALINSSDYATEMYNVRIDQLESRKALTRLLPGIEFSYAGNFTSNSFLWNSLWGELGLRLAGDLLKLITIPDILEYAEVSKHLAKSRRLAVNTAVIAGVHLAWQDYTNRIERLKQVSFLNEIDNDIAKLTRNAEKNRSGSEVEAIQSEFKAFNSQLHYLVNYALTQESFGSFLVSLGSNPVPDNYQHLSIQELSTILSERNKLWEQGKLEILTPDDMKKRIRLKKKKESQRSWWEKLLERPVTMPAVKYTTLKSSKAKPVVKKKEPQSKTLKVKKATPNVIEMDSSYQDGYFVVE